ncbi:MAG: hypothetical protein WCD79_13755 [Chthoniobacteraceae bacterium]
MKLFLHQTGNSESAYILLEVMLATTIFAMVAVALAILLNETMEASVQMRRENSVIWNLESKMAEIRIKRLVAGKEESPLDASGINYETEISPLNLRSKDSFSLTGLFNIKITARWKQGSRVEEEVAQTYVYQP